MADREKTINGLECCTTMDEYGYPSCEKCPYSDVDGTCPNIDALHRDALELLREQEPVKPITTGKGILERTRCGACGSEIANSHFYCWYCGKKVKWDAVGESPER